jgi:hypothetical protein
VRRPGGALFGAPLAIIALVALTAVLPFAWLGNASGHDFEFHMYSWLEVLGQWKQGIAYPRWAALSHWGYGEARFLFYPPLSWHLGGLIAAIVPWTMASGAYIWVALTLAGISMFCLARQYLGRSDAIFAAAVYAANPYMLVIVYWRSAFAELLAASLLPLLLLFALRLARDQRGAFLPLSFVMAGVWLTNAPSAVMANYSLGIMLVALTLLTRKWSTLVYGGLAALLGLGLGAFYVLPAAYETRWVNIAEVLSPGVRPVDNFLLTMTDSPDHNRFNLLVSLIAAAEIVVVAGTARMARRSIRQKPALWSLLAVWAGTAAVLMLSPTLIFWNVLPKLRFVQLPWRWLLCLGVPLALFMVIGIRRWPARIFLYVVMLLVLTVGWQRVQPPWWDEAADMKEMTDAMEDKVGYEGTEEYVPVGIDSSDVKPDAHPVIVEGHATVKISRWAPESKDFTVTASEPSHLVLKLFHYPAWKVDVNGKPVVPRTVPKTGQMLIAVPKGESRVEISFTRTWDRTLGIAISLLAVFFAVGIGVWQKRTRDLHTA